MMHQSHASLAHIMRVIDLMPFTASPTLATSVVSRQLIWRCVNKIQSVLCALCEKLNSKQPRPVCDVFTMHAATQASTPMKLALLSLAVGPLCMLLPRKAIAASFEPTAPGDIDLLPRRERLLDGIAIHCELLLLFCARL